MTASDASWRTLLPPAIRSYAEPAPIAALFLGISSGFPYAMIGATLSTRLAQGGVDKKTVTAFALAFLVYNLKPFWAPLVDRARIPVLGRFGQRRSWLWLSGAAVIAAVVHLGWTDPAASIGAVAVAAIIVGIAGATFDIVIDAYRIELLAPGELGVGSGMSQYGWRIGSAGAGALALVVADRGGWGAAYALCAAFALPAMAVGLVLGEPARRLLPGAAREMRAGIAGVLQPFANFLGREGALLTLLFILVHKLGDTLANLSFRLLFNDLGFTNDEIATWDVGVGFVAYLVGIFAGGLMFTRLGLKGSVWWSLVLMAVSNLSFAGLAAIGHSNAAMAGAIGFENLASGIGGVTVVAYFSALCDLRFTATQYALISAAASIGGRLASGLGAGALIEEVGYVDFYLLTTLAAVPGVLLFAVMMRSGLVDRSTVRPSPSDARDA